jgi:hypothetical protein
MTLSTIRTVFNRNRAVTLGAAGLVGLLLATAACRDATSARELQLGQSASLPGNAPVLVSCQSGQRAFVRQTLVNGQVVPQVECVSDAGIAPAVAPAYGTPQTYGAAQTTMTYGPQPVSYQPAGPYSQPVVYAPQPAIAQPAVYSAPAPRPVVERRVVYERRPVYDNREVRSSGRSWKKSAIIIGSSAGVGAGVGAAVGGKKGALIGAAIGGGGAAIWDQATRR